MTLILTSHYMADVEALCSRLVLLLQGKVRFDGPLVEFAKILGHEKNVSFIFSSPQSPQDPFFLSFDPQWNIQGTQVEIRVAENRLREVTRTILKDYPVVDFHTEKLPIERVLKTLILSS